MKNMFKQKISICIDMLSEMRQANAMVVISHACFDFLMLKVSQYEAFLVEVLFSWWLQQHTELTKKTTPSPEFFFPRAP